VRKVGEVPDIIIAAAFDALAEAVVIAAVPELERRKAAYEFPVEVAPGDLGQVVQIANLRGLACQEG
jgi:hypothetical protein